MVSETHLRMFDSCDILEIEFSITTYLLKATRCTWWCNDASAWTWSHRFCKIVAWKWGIDEKISNHTAARRAVQHKTWTSQYARVNIWCCFLCCLLFTLAADASAAVSACTLVGNAISWFDLVHLMFCHKNLWNCFVTGGKKNITKRERNTHVLLWKRCQWHSPHSIPMFPPLFVTSTAVVV